MSQKYNEDYSAIRRDTRDARIAGGQLRSAKSTGFYSRGIISMRPLHLYAMDRNNHESIIVALCCQMINVRGNTIIIGNDALCMQIVMQKRYRLWNIYRSSTRTTGRTTYRILWNLRCTAIRDAVTRNGYNRTQTLHPDNDRQHTNHEYHKLLAKYGLQQNVESTHCCINNARMADFSEQSKISCKLCFDMNRAKII